MNLDVIISVGYRVKSRRGTQFRIWANSVLKEYLIKGYAVKNNLIQERYDELKALVDTLGRTMLIGYARCSTADQNLDWQLDALTKNGCERIYQEKVTGTKKERPELNRMLEALRDGDTVIVCELTRLSRSTNDLFELVEKINGCGADVKSLKESWLDTTTPHGKLLFTISAGISQFERDLTHERTRDGLAAARARGRLGGRPKTDEKKIQQAMAMYDANDIPIKDILETTGISRATLYAYLRKRKK